MLLQINHCIARYTDPQQAVGLLIAGFIKCAFFFPYYRQAGFALVVVRYRYTAVQLFSHCEYLVSYIPSLKNLQLLKPCRGCLQSDIYRPKRASYPPCRNSTHPYWDNTNTGDMRRGQLRVAISTAPDLSGSGGVDMPITTPVAAACELLLLERERWVKWTHEMCFRRGSVRGY